MATWTKQVGAYAFKIRAARIEDRAAVNTIVHYWAEKYDSLTLRLFKLEEVLNQKPFVCERNREIVGYADTYRLFLKEEIAESSGGIGTALLAAYMCGVDEYAIVTVAVFRKYHGKVVHILKKLAEVLGLEVKELPNSAVEISVKRGVTKATLNRNSESFLEGAGWKKSEN